MRLPDFLIIGAAKSGTTTLYRYLNFHPEIYMSPIKEPMFFADDEIYDRGLDWYKSLFSGAKEGQLCGEASTDYTKFPDFPETAFRIAQNLPHVKMIYLMRNPIDRAYAYYVHLHRRKDFKGFEETFEEHIRRTSISLDISNYLLQIERYLKFFDRNSFLFILMEDLIENRDKVWQETCQFLGVDDRIDLLPKRQIVENSRKKVFESKMRKEISNLLKGWPVISPVLTLVPQQWKHWGYENIIKKSPYGKELMKKYNPIPMLPETRQMLVEKFRPLNEKLAEFLGRDLSHWSQ